MALQTAWNQLSLELFLIRSVLSFPINTLFYIWILDLTLLDKIRLDTIIYLFDLF